MNLLIEQRPTTITSKLHITNHNDMNNSSSSSSPLVLKLKRHRTKQQNDFNLNSSFMANEDNNNNNNKSRSSTNNQRLKRPIPTSTATRRPSSPAFNGKQQATKRSVTIDNNNNDLTPNIDEISATKKFKRDDLNQSASTKVDASVETVSIGLATEPDHLGPCEPGTSVVLEGIVWNETDSGVLVVNVTWRGKTYVGTLLDSTKQDWACPRLTCESPTSDYDPRNNSKTSRTKRTSTGNHNRCSNHQSISSFQHLTSTVLLSGLDDRKLRNNIKSRQSKRTNLTTTDETITPLTSPFPNETNNSSSNNESQLIPCSESQCHKRFTSTIALDYHLSNAHKKSEEILSSIQQPSTRDEEDVAHILANVADYVRRASPPASIRSSPEHQRPTTLTWPCPQISSELILSSPLNNNEQTSIPLSTNTTRCTLNNTEPNIIDNSLKINTDQDEIKSSLSTVKPVDHFLLHIQDEPLSACQQTLSPPSWSNLKKDRISNNNKKSLKIPTPPPSSSSSFVPIKFPASIPPPPTSSSPAYSDISDEDPTTNENEQQISPSTINLLTGTNGKMTDEQTSSISNTPWTTQMLLQQYGSYIQQQQSFIGTNKKELTSNRLNSKHNHSSSNGTSDSTVKNILDTRRLSTTKPPTPPIATNETNSLLNDYQKSLYHYHTNGLSNDSKLSPTIMNSLTSPNENLLNPSSTINPLDYSLNNTCSHSLHPSR